MSKSKSGGMGLIGGLILVFIIWACGSYWGHRHDREHPPTKPSKSTPADHKMQDDLPTGKVKK